MDELNKMGVEAVAKRERTSVTGEGAQEAYDKLKKEINAMRREGVTPLPAQP